MHNNGKNEKSKRRSIPNIKRWEGQHNPVYWSLWDRIEGLPTFLWVCSVQLDPKPQQRAPYR